MRLSGQAMCCTLARRAGRGSPRRGWAALGTKGINLFNFQPALRPASQCRPARQALARAEARAGGLPLAASLAVAAAAAAASWPQLFSAAHGSHATRAGFARSFRLGRGGRDT